MRWHPLVAAACAAAIAAAIPLIAQVPGGAGCGVTGTPNCNVFVAGGSTDASIGLNNAAAPSSSTQIGTQDLSGNLQAVSAVNPLPATISLPSGAATSALQTTGNAALATIATNTGAAIPAGTNIIGKVGIDQTTPGTTNGVQVNAALPAGTNNIGSVQPVPGTTGGLTMFYLTAANTTNATNVKGSAGTLYDVELSNNSATPAYVSFYNNSGTPTCGSSIVWQAMIPGNSTSGGGWVSDSAFGKSFSSGIAICVTTGIAGTGSVAASTYTVSLGYK